MERKGKNYKGKQRVEIKKIENEDARYICFTKRRMGLFTKACDLSTLCGPAIAVVVFSPAGTCYSFGCPNVHDVVDQFLSGSAPAVSGDSERQGGAMQKLNQECMGLAKKMEAAKAQKAVLQERLRMAESQAHERMWLESMEDLGPEELVRLKESLQRLQVRANSQINDLLDGGQHRRPATAGVAFNAVGAIGPGGGGCSQGKRSNQGGGTPESHNSVMAVSAVNMVPPDKLLDMGLFPGFY